MNFYKALKAHVIISVVAYLSYAITDKFADKRISILNVIIILIMYLLSGIFMDSLESRLDNFKSVAVIFGLGAVIWIISVAIMGLGPISLKPNWLICSFYTAYFLPVVKIFKIESPIVYLFAALIPTVLMWLGIELKKVVGVKKNLV